ncbi:DUF192 domain-containing protein [Algibacter sp.]|uniref:DUF192 domain-containing protein n=1 Tax=Algibacter sp. TaxID=1872428 RepID=UPI003C76760B
MQLNNMFLKRFFFFLTLSLTIVSIGCKKDKKAIKQTEVAFTKEGELTILKVKDSTKVTLDIEIAETAYEIETGLMYRNAMKNNQGMLFIFDNNQPRNFYMKNTKIPLDLIFINAAKSIVSFQKNAKPLDESSLPSNAPAKYVLEVNAGLVENWGVTVGDVVDFIP